jgi:ABC-type Na+ transport system ATPase subunit NatA
MIIARSLTKSYADLLRGPVLALDGVSFSATAGQVTGRWSEPGRQITALRILGTVLQPTSGTAIVGGSIA